MKELLNLNQSKVHILELSSFQLEHIFKLSLKVACILNLSKDHLDRYENYDEYVNSKLNIIKSIRNIPNMKIIEDKGANIYDLLKYKNVIFTITSIKSLQEKQKIFQSQLIQKKIIIIIQIG